MIAIRVRHRRALLILGAVFVLFGCGQKGPLRLPEPETPAAVIDLWGPAEVALYTAEQTGFERHGRTN